MIFEGPFWPKPFYNSINMFPLCLETEAGKEAEVGALDRFWDIVLKDWKGVTLPT